MRPGLAIVTVAMLGGQLVGLERAPLGLLAIPLFPFLAWLALGRRHPALARSALALGGFAIGAVSAGAVFAPDLPEDHVARLALPLRTVLRGRIVAAPERRDTRLVLAVEAASVGRGGAQRRVSGRVRVTLRHASRAWRYGDRLVVTTTLRAPRNFGNPGRFDYVGYLARRGVRVTAYVWDDRTMRRRPGRLRGLRARLERWRRRVAALATSAAPPEKAAVLRALVIGDRGGVPPALREAFTRAGLAHLLAISGLHVGIVGAAAYVGLRWLLGRSEQLLLRVDVERVARSLALLPVLLYAALAGFGVATIRATLMVAAVVTAGFVGRRLEPLRALALAAIVIMLVQPGAPREVGFQLSFAAVGAIVLGVRRLGPPGSGWGRRIRTLILVPTAAFLGTAPLTAFSFHQVSLMSVPANLIAAPLLGAVVVVPGLLGALLEPWGPGISATLFALVGRMLTPGLWLVQRLAAPGWAAVDVPIPSVWELVLLYATLAGLILLPRPGGRVLLISGALGLVVNAAAWLHVRGGHGHVRITFLDVGQGDAAVVELPNGRVLVVDGGGFPSGTFDPGAAIVSPFLRSRKIGRLDAVAMTHAHPDHSAGLAFLLTHHGSREFWWTGHPGAGRRWRRLQRAIARSGARVRVLAAGARLPTFAPGVSVLHPPPRSDGLSLNDASLVLRVEHRLVTVLLTGDVEAAGEARLLDGPGPLRSDVLKVPHHGSRTSSSPRFLEAVAPSTAVISVGAHNRYGLPTPEVEARYRARGTCVLRTDRCGAITLETDGRRLRVRGDGPSCACPGDAPG